VLSGVIPLWVPQVHSYFTSKDSTLALAAGFIYDIFPAVTTVLIGTMLGSALGFYVTRTLLKEWVKEYVESRPLLMVQLKESYLIINFQFLKAFMKTMETHGFKLIVIMRMAPVSNPDKCSILMLILCLDSLWISKCRVFGTLFSPFPPPRTHPPPFRVSNYCMRLTTMLALQICDIPFGSFSLASFLGLLPEIVMLVYMGISPTLLFEFFLGGGREEEELC